jgi:hypothetical protein
MVILVQFGIGLLFGLGLVIAGMSDPAKVLNFLDLAAIAIGRRRRLPVRGLQPP